MTAETDAYPSAEAHRLQELRDAEQRALDDLRSHGELVFVEGWTWVPLQRGFGVRKLVACGPTWAPPDTGDGEHHGARLSFHEPPTIQRLVKAGKVVLLRDRTRCVLWPGGAS